MHAHLPKLSALLSGLSDKFLTPKVIVIHSISQEVTQQSWEPDWVSWEDFVQQGAQHKLGRSQDGEIEWHRLSFDAPLWVLFSSGTTGRPKYVLFIKSYLHFDKFRNHRPIVHRAGGMLLQAKKEFVICSDLRPDDVFFYYTTTFVPVSSNYPAIYLLNPRIRGWMMWNFLVSSLTIGCTLVLYDGSPLRDVSLLWKLVDDLGITIFGTSAKYLDQLSVST